MDPAARVAVEQADAIRIYLRCTVEELWRRINQDVHTTSKRPNLTDLDGGVDEIRAVLQQRDPIYKEVADTVFDVTNVSVDDAVQHLVTKYL